MPVADALAEAGHWLPTETPTTLPYVRLLHAPSEMKSASGGAGAHLPDDNAYRTAGYARVQVAAFERVWATAQPLPPARDREIEDQSGSGNAESTSTV